MKRNTGKWTVMFFPAQVYVQGIPVLHVPADVLQQGYAQLGGFGHFGHVALSENHVIEEPFGHILGFDVSVVAYMDMT